MRLVPRDVIQGHLGPLTSEPVKTEAADMEGTRDEATGQQGYEQA